MMYNKADFPTSQHEMVVYAGTVLGYIKVPANLTRLGITTAKLDTVTTNVGMLTENWDKSGDPNLHTSIVTEELNKDIRLVKENFTSIFSEIKEDVFTIADRQTFRMAERAVAMPIPVVDHSPVFMIKSVAFLLLKLLFINSATPESKAMPKGHKIFFEYYIGVAGLTAGNIPFANALNISNAFYTLQFHETDLGKTVYMHCYYENARGQRSPVSVTISKVIA
jgi:hypothetical protein